MNMKMVRLGDVCTVVTGSTPKTSVDEYWNGAVDWITPAELTDDTYIINESKRKITSLAVKKTGLKSFPKDTVILSSRAPIGKVAIAGKEMYCNQGFKNLICSSEINSRYLYWYLKSKTEYLNSLGRGATFKELSKSIVENILIPLPSLEIQEKQVGILEKCSNIIKMYRKQIQDCKILSQSRFTEIFGDLASPECTWDKYQFVDVCKEKDDIKCGPFGTQLSKDEYKKSGVAVWEIPQINTAFTTEPTHYLTEEKAKQLKAYTIISGDIAMSRKGNVGKCALFPESYPNGIIHSDVLRIRVNRKVVNPMFMMCQLHFSGAITKQIELVSSGAIMAGINVTKLKQIYVHVPPMKLQNQFVAFVRSIDKLKATIQKSMDEAQTLFDSLMQEYFG